MRLTVAIDGPAAAGKGTISKAVAAHFGFAHLDTGLLYRAVGAKFLAGAAPVEAALSLAKNGAGTVGLLRFARNDREEHLDAESGLVRYARKTQDADPQQNVTG